MRKVSGQQRIAMRVWRPEAAETLRIVADTVAAPEGDSIGVAGDHSSDAVVAPEGDRYGDAVVASEGGDAVVASEGGDAVVAPEGDRIGDAIVAGDHAGTSEVDFGSGGPTLGAIAASPSSLVVLTPAMSSFFSFAAGFPTSTEGGALLREERPPPLGGLESATAAGLESMF